MRLMLLRMYVSYVFIIVYITHLAQMVLLERVNKGEIRNK